MRQKYPLISALVLLSVGSLISDVFAARISDIRNTKHNFSAVVKPATIERNASATSESQICAFCHTPHGATAEPKAPIWNRKLSSATYTPYTSTSLDAIDLNDPGGKSKLCLSCHDGTLALGSVNVLNRKVNQKIEFTGVKQPVGSIPEGDQGELSGFTRRLGTDLTNDHPISFTYDSAQAARDGELYDPNAVSHLHTRLPGEKPTLPLEENKVECVSCHDPHIRSDIPGENIKFLRVNRFQVSEPVDGAFSKENDIICLGCHDKEGWVGSAHANTAVANERYTDAAADLREFPRNMRVWQAACLNCHDPHAVQGTRRILREGTDGPLQLDPTTGGKFKQGGNYAVEEVCYACHANPTELPATTVETLQGQNSQTFEVPDIKTDFVTMKSHMPISSTNQPAGFEVHSIGTGDAVQGDQRGQDFVEAREKLGKGNLNNRHAECTDCHNPHRVMKNHLFNAPNAVPDASGTHEHKDGVPHTNLASGVLRGIWGVEPSIWPSTAFGSEPIGFDVKRGDPGTGGSTDVSAPYVTREYQVCMKCHSNYGYDQAPQLGYYSGGTPPGTNDLFDYTNQGMEYQSPIDHSGEGTSATPTGAFEGTISCSDNPSLDSLGNINKNSDGNNVKIIDGRLDSDNNCVDYVKNNHRSWHPVMRPTGRTPSVRGGQVQNVWRAPFNAAVGTQTMYCTDCHGSVTPGDSVVPLGGENGAPWGPHGSNSNFLLKGDWDTLTGENNYDVANPASESNHLCFRCHDGKQYASDFGTTPSDSGINHSGFKVAASTGGCLQFKSKNLHVGHARGVTNFRCTYCHVSIPHGWKNKVFLANLNDVGLEAPLKAGEIPDVSGRRQVRNGPLGVEKRYVNGPYYNGSVLKVSTFARSGTWLDSNCGSAGLPGNGVIGVNWMNANSESCANLP